MMFPKKALYKSKPDNESSCCIQQINHEQVWLGDVYKKSD
jgi:hypothetical protein